MRLTTSEIQIMEIFTNNIFLELSINNIAKRLDKHYRVVRVNVLRLLKKNLIKCSEIAGAKLISLNITSAKLPSYMAYVEEVMVYNKMFRIFPHIEGILKSARGISPSYCLGVFGSYAQGTQKKGSDIDMFIICSSGNTKKYENLIKQFPAIEDQVHWNVFSIQEFKKGLKTKGMLIYKEIIKNKLIISGAELFYNMIAEVGKIED